MSGETKEETEKKNLMMISFSILNFQLYLPKALEEEIK